MGRMVIEDRGGWWSATATPHPALRPFLDSYTGYWQKTADPAVVRTTPTRHTVVIVNLGPPMLLRMPGSPDRSYGSFVAGMNDGPGVYRHPGGIRGIQLDLTPLGSYTLFGIPLQEITNIAVDLGDLFGPGTDAFVERLAEAPGWADRFALLDRLLLRRLEIGPEPSPEVARAWQLLSGSAGLVRVADLADEVGWSRKHLVNRFKEQVGLPPKVMGRVLRFHRALDLLRQGTRNWAELAAECGFYDQAHLNREFRALAGCTPTDLLHGSP